MPEAALLKVQSFLTRRGTFRVASYESPKRRQSLSRWVSREGSSLIIIPVSPGTQADAKELVVGVIGRLKTSTYYVLRTISLISPVDGTPSIIEVLKSLVFQSLQHSRNLFSDDNEHLNLKKMHGNHTESEWADLLVLVFAKLSKCFVVIETEDLH